MDSNHFDALSRALYTRRRVVIRTAGLGAATLAAVLGLSHLDEASANCKKKCGPCKRCKKGKCKPKPAGTACAGGTCQGGSCVPPAAAPPGPTCTDGIRNGSETDVDCGGTCPRCADFKSCASRDDCRGALCQGDVCRVCDPAITNQCGQDVVGPCSCQTRTDGQQICVQRSFVNLINCSLCPPGTQCVDTGAAFIRCFKICGAS